MITVINKLLNMYLVKGTVELDRDVSSVEKLSSVGFLTKNVGGKRNSSLSGLKAVEIR